MTTPIKPIPIKPTPDKTVRPREVEVSNTTLRVVDGRLEARVGASPNFQPLLTPEMLAAALDLAKTPQETLSPFDAALDAAGVTLDDDQAQAVLRAALQTASVDAIADELKRRGWRQYNSAMTAYQVLGTNSVVLLANA
jgi:hypothetical protein